MTATLTRIALTLLLLGLGRPAAAGPGDTPLPTFADGKPAQAVYTEFGVIKSNKLETDFVCNNLDAAPDCFEFYCVDEYGAVNSGLTLPATLFKGSRPAGQACPIV